MLYPISSSIKVGSQLLTNSNKGIVFVGKIDLGIKKVVEADVQFSSKLVDENIVRPTHSTTVSNLPFEFREKGSKAFPLGLMQSPKTIQSFLP